MTGDYLTRTQRLTGSHLSLPHNDLYIFILQNDCGTFSNE